MSEYKYVCELCDYHTNGSQSFYQHKKTKKHLYELEENQYRRQLDNLPNKKNGRYYCQICNFQTNTRQSLHRHKKSKRHIKKYEDCVCQHSCKPSLQKKLTVNQIIDDRSCKNACILGKYKYVKKEGNLVCKKCFYRFKHRQSLFRHIKLNTCIPNKYKNKEESKNIEKVENKEKEKVEITNNTTNNTTNNNITNYTITHDNKNVINIVFNINSVEEAEKIKSLLTSQKIKEICKPEHFGLPRQSYDIVKKIQDLSIQSKKNNKELQNFRKTNYRNDLISVFNDNQFKVVDFKQYNRNDLLKFAQYIIDHCDDGLEPNKSNEEKLELICDVLKDYDHYKNLDEDMQDGTTQYIITAIDECERLSKLEHYNITINEEGDGEI